MPLKNDLPESIALTYRLSELPTAQHKAGLAGILLLIRNLQERTALGQVVGPLPEIKEIGPDGVTLHITPESLQSLFDDFYNAEFFATKKGKNIPKPTANFLRHWITGSSELWTKQLADALTGVIYSKPTTWVDFKNRASGKLTKKAADLYKRLAIATDDESANQKIKGQHFIGAETENAEKVGFIATSRLFLLLHFWIVATPIFTPRQLKDERDQATGERYLESELDPSSYLFVVPEPSNLEAFVDEMQDYWRRLSGRRTGYRPSDAVIDVPAEASLEFLIMLAGDRANTPSISLTVLRLELYALTKKRNNAIIRAVQGFEPRPEILSEYKACIRNSNGHPLFKRLVIDNLICGRHWHTAASLLFSQHPVEFFIGSPLKSRFRSFGHETHKRFTTLINELVSLERQKEFAMTDRPKAPMNDVLARRIYHLVGAYVRKKTAEKCGRDINDMPRNDKDQPIYSADYREIREKVAKDAFLALRGRRDGDIGEYFIGTLCAVPQFVREDDFVAIGRALIEEPQQVKELTMLALSAHSWLPGQKADEPTEDNAPV